MGKRRRRSSSRRTASTTWLAVGAVAVLGVGVVGLSAAALSNTGEPSAAVSSYTPAPIPTYAPFPRLTLAEGAPEVLIVGDSFARGVGAQPETRGWAYLFGEQMGWPVTVEGHGGSGYVHSPEPDVQYAARIQEFADENPDYAPTIVILQGSINDLPDLDGLETAAADAVALTSSLWPDAKIVSTAPIADENYSYVADELMSAAGTQTLTIPLSTTRAWLAGSTDLYSADGVHPSPTGHQAIADGMAEVFRWWLEPGSGVPGRYGAPTKAELIAANKS